jgi:hypothetical protein
MMGIAVEVLVRTKGLAERFMRFGTIILLGMLVVGEVEKVGKQSCNQDTSSNSENDL